MQEDQVDGGYNATALGYGIHTQGDTLDELREMNGELRMRNYESFQPQMTQMNADVFLEFFICAHLRNLRLNKVLKEILREPGVNFSQGYLRGKIPQISRESAAT